MSDSEIIYADGEAPPVEEVEQETRDAYEYVRDGALLKCDKGSLPCPLTAISKNVKMYGQVICTSRDNQPGPNQLQFGVCSVTRKACKNCIGLGNWTKTKSDMFIKGRTALLERSEIRCATGGKLEFMNSGQVPGQSNVVKTREEVPESPNAFLINADGSIEHLQSDSAEYGYYIQVPADGSYTLVNTLTENEHGLVEFPATGDGFDRYGTSDRGGRDAGVGETVGQGDHWITPETAAALYGVVNELSAAGITLSLGDMSSSNGSDPWQAGFAHHAGHGHNGNRVGQDVDFRYLNGNGTDIQGGSASTDPAFSEENNRLVYTAAARFGFGVNYQGTRGVEMPNARRVGGHNDHGHLGRTGNLANITVIAN